MVVELLRLPAGPTQGIVGRWAVSSWIMRGDWLSATIEACPARNTAPLIERDVSRRSPGWCPVRRARPPARRCIPRHRRRWRWACLPRSAGCTSTTAFRSRWAVPTARTQAAARDGLPQAPGPARSTQNSPICTTLVGRPGTPAKVHSGSCAARRPSKSCSPGYRQQIAVRAGRREVLLAPHRRLP